MSTQRWYHKLFTVTLFMFCLQGCAFQVQQQEMIPIRTWTPIAQPTDRPFQAQPENLSYFGETPVLVIFGSQDPMDTSPLKVLNISTDDAYDVSTITPASTNTWSRPIAAENKEVYFQVGGTLYVLSPGGQNRSIKLPYDAENPAYCNWSWQGQLVCLNNAMTTGFLVDQDLNVVEMVLPTDERIGSEGYYEPYRVGENGMRAIYALPEITSTRATAFYKDLDLETLTVQSKRIRIDEDLYETFRDLKGANELDVMVLTREEGEINVIGISDSGDKVYLASHVTYTMPYRGGGTKTRWWTDVYDGSILDTLNVDFGIVPDLGMSFNSYYLITSWLVDLENAIIKQPTVYDLAAGNIVFEAAGSLNNNEVVNFILPYADGWVAGDTLGVHYYHNSGGLLFTYPFPNEIIESMGQDSYFTVSQPMEP